MRPYKKIGVFQVTGLEVLDRVGTHIFFMGKNTILNKTFCILSSPEPDQSLSVHLSCLCLSCISFFFKRHLLLNHWSKFQITSHECSHDVLFQKCINGSAPLNGKAPRAPDKIFLTTSPEVLAQIQNNFTELFLITPSNKIAQMVLRC